MFKDLIISILSSNSDEFISGENISSTLGISRAAVWKYIKALRNEGYIIESYSRKGYRLIEIPATISLNSLENSLSSNSIINKILYFKTIDSTNDFCKVNSSELIDGTLVLAETQTNGKGRFQREWFSPKGTGLFCSLFLKPNLHLYDISKVTSIICAAIAKTLIKMNIPILVKWPNDIYLNGKKLGGILTEMRGDMDQINYLIIGFGLNINQLNNDFPEELQEVAISLRSCFNKKFNREEILNSVLNNFEYFYKLLTCDSKCQEAFDIIKNNSYVLHKEVQIIRGNNKITGTVIGLGENGELILDTNGSIEKIFSGEVSLRMHTKGNSI